MVIRRVFSNGSSKLIAIPPTYLAAINTTIGDYVAVELQSTGSIKITKVDTQNAKIAKKLPKQEA